MGIMNKVEEFIFGVGKIKKVKKDLFKSLLALISTFLALILFLINLLSKNYIKAIGYGLSCCFLILLFIKFANDYYISKFISQFSK